MGTTTEPTYYPVIEYDPNDGTKPITTVITTNYATNLHIGTIVLAVCLDHHGYHLDWGIGLLATIIDNQPSEYVDGYHVIEALPLPDQHP